MKRWLFRHASPWWLLAALLCWPAFEGGLLLHRAQQPGVDAGAIIHDARQPAARVGAAMDWWFDCRRNSACLTSKVQATMGAVAKSAGQSEIASKEAVATLKDIHPRANAVLDEAAGTLQEAHAALEALTSLVGAMRADVDQLTSDGSKLVQSSTVAVQRLTDSLDEIRSLAEKLGQQIDANSPLAIQTLTNLNQAIADLDKLLTDPNIEATIAHAEGTSKHLESSAESIDIAMKPWREKAKLLKVIASKAYEFLLHALTLFK